MIRFFRTQVLWIEDSTQFDLSHLIPPVRLSGKYDLTISRNATEAWELLSKDNTKFDIVIYDLELPPGDNPVLQAYYRNPDSAETPHKAAPEYLLGTQLFLLWLGHEDRISADTLKPFRLDTPLSPTRMGVLSVFAETLSDNDFFKGVGIPAEFILQKRHDLPKRALLDLIERIARQS